MQLMANCENSNFQQILAPVLRNECIGPGQYLIRFRSPVIARSVNSGQFINIKVSDGNTPLLRRPFSVYDTDGKDWIEVVYGVIGEGTKLLSSKKEGEILSLIGPLGNTFQISSNLENTNIILIGGGLGIPPIHFFAKTLQKNEITFQVFLGAKTGGEVISKIKFSTMTDKLWISTDDGSSGIKGTVLDVLENRWKTDNCFKNSKTIIYSCGPEPMLKALSLWANHNNIQIHVSMESMMGCGFGVCLGCAVKTVHGNKFVCCDGPVFDGSEILWE